ncbi:GDSL-type esterase/lipase family protein [Alteromonas sp. D210916BOD_24]|uniref:GDSL-type esterase/lipase family protein n=1 Tax=Alteromonas sp. D210916BOD_24 TaxID=3157618 RepID=UPI00399CAEC6
MKNILIGILFVGIICLSFLYLKASRAPSPQSYFVQSTHVFYKRVDRQLSHLSALFIGDSMVQGLAVSEISKNAINFGIGTDTVSGVRTRLSEYVSVNKANCLFVHVGINDLLKGHSLQSTIAEFSLLFASLAHHPLVLVGEVLPVTNTSPKLASIFNDISAFNAILAAEIEKHDNVILIPQHDVFLGEGNEMSDLYHNGDGLHLSTSGNLVWINHLKQQLLKYQCEIEM